MLGDAQPYLLQLQTTARETQIVSIQLSAESINGRLVPKIKDRCLWNEYRRNIRELKAMADKCYDQAEIAIRANGPKRSKSKRGSSY